MWLPLVHPQLGTWPATQACALTGNQTGDSLVHRPALNPLSHTSQGFSVLFNKIETQRYYFVMTPHPQLAVYFKHYGPYFFMETENYSIYY